MLKFVFEGKRKVLARIQAEKWMGTGPVSPPVPTRWVRIFRALDDFYSYEYCLKSQGWPERRFFFAFLRLQFSKLSSESENLAEITYILRSRI